MVFKKYILTLISFFLLLPLAAQPSHEIWDNLLAQNVAEDGDVNYKGFIKNKEKLEEYLQLLSSNSPEETWSKNEKLAYWINAYNAFTVKLIVDNYPLESIKDLNPTISIPTIRTIWHKEFFEIGGEPESLNDIEHEILRKEFDEPRIHFAINCASQSCPDLRNEAYKASMLEYQLHDQAVKFINDPSKNRISQNVVKVNKIFSWFRGDFTENGSLKQFLNRYSHYKISGEQSINFMEYDWSLNE